MTGWDWFCSGAFLLYTGQLAAEDGKTGTFRLRTLLAGGLCGLLLRLAGLIRFGGQWTAEAGAVLIAVLPGIGLVLLGKLTRGAIGKGDGLCFMSFGIWWGAEQVFSLLFLSLLLLGCVGLFLICFRNGKRDLRLPFGPFILAAAVLQLGLGLLMPS